MSTNPDERLKSLQTSCPQRLVLRAAIQCDSRKDATRLEHILHDAYRLYSVGYPYGVRNEWIEIDVDRIIRDFIMLVNASRLITNGILYKHTDSVSNPSRFYKIWWHIKRRYQLFKFKLSWYL